MSLALAGFGSYAYYVSQTQNLGYPDSAVVGQHDWIPLLCVLVFTTALALGISPISWLLIGELFPLEYRGLGSSISTSFSYFCAFVGIKLFMDFQQVKRCNRNRNRDRDRDRDRNSQHPRFPLTRVRAFRHSCCAVFN